MLVTILLILVIVLTLVTCLRLMKVFDFSAKLRGRNPWDISEGENNFNALLVLLSLVGLFGMFFYLNYKYYDKEMLIPIASVHGKAVNDLLHLNFVVITIPFLITQTLLMWFVYKYRYNKKRKATHYAHNTKLEIVWTAVPAIVMVVLIWKGLILWNEQMSKSDDPNRIHLEFYAKQFDWTARFAGEDKKLGDANYTMISDVNALGLITPESIKMQLDKCKRDAETIDSTLKYKFLVGKKYDDAVLELRRKKFQIQRVIEFEKLINDKKYTTAYDDIIVKDEIHLPVNRVVELHLRSQDVIHSAYLPNFRVHLYCVPGVETSFTFTPNVTTAEMRQKTGNPNFNYLLYCNNICGSSHFNMQMKIIIESEESYKEWMKSQKTFAQNVLGIGVEEDKKETEPVATDTTKNDTNAVKPIAKK